MEFYYVLDLRTILGYQLASFVAPSSFPDLIVTQQLDLCDRVPSIYYVWHRIVKIEPKPASHDQATPALYIHQIAWIDHRPPTPSDLLAYNLSAERLALAPALEPVGINLRKAD